MKTIIFITLLITASTIYADVPNKFSSNNPPTASKLNSNFNNLDNRVKNSKANITAIEDVVNGTVDAVNALDERVTTMESGIGASYGMIRLFQQDDTLLGYYMDGALTVGDNWSVITENKFVLTLNSGLVSGGFYPHNSAGREFVYESADCTGQAYIASFEPGVHASFGFLVKNYNQNDFDDVQPWYYIPIAATKVTIDKQSKKLNGTCSSEGGAGNMLPVYPNDSNVTGFSGLDNPITVKLPFEN